MKAKLLLALLVVSLALSIAVLIPDAPQVQADEGCSGDQCGCYLLGPPCIAACPQTPQSAYWACVGECRQQIIQCSIACCT